MGSTQDGKGTVVPVSKDTSPNTAANPVHVNEASVGASATAMAVNAGNLSDGVQRVTLCTDGVVGACSQSIAAATGTKGLVVLGVDGGAVNRAVPVAVDGQTAAVNLIQVGGTDGTNAQTLSLDTAGRLYTNRNWTIAGESVPDGWTAVQTSGHYSVATAGSASVNGANVEVMGSTQVDRYRQVSIIIYNSGAQPLTECTVSASNDNSIWVSLIPVYGALETACRSLASTVSGIAFYSIDCPFKYIKLQCSSGAATSIAYYFFGRA